MENEKDKTTEENTNIQPKPTDDVQMDIETVVPSAHKEEVDPSKPVDENTNESQEQPKDTEDTAEKSDEVAQTGSESKAPESEGLPVTEGEKGAETADQSEQSTTEEISENEEDTEEATEKTR